MDYDQFLHKDVPEDSCDCTNKVCLAISLMAIIYLVAECIVHPSQIQKEKIAKLKTENENLRSILMKSVDRAFVRMMKNGNDSDDEDE
jgi:hypothetical protein